MVLAMLVLPQLIVVGWSFMERDIGGRLPWETRVSTEEKLGGVAYRWGTRIRIVAIDGKEKVDVDADRGTDLVHQIGTLFFGPDGAPTLREFDETLGPVPARMEVVKVTGWNEHPPAP